MRRERGELKRWQCFYGSLRLSSKDERRKAKADIAKGDEPQTYYTTGRLWVD
jgi:hypothetical protein